MFVSRQAHFMRILLSGIIVVKLQSVTCGTIQKKMVFEAFSYNDDTAYDLFIGDGVSTPSGAEHFKDPLVNMWGNQILVHEVTVSIMKNSLEKAFVVFDGTGTSKTSWMQRDKILNSSYTDIRTGTSPIFSVEGNVLPDQKGRRAFYMNKSFYGCANDVGWIQVLVGTGFCPWEKTSPTMTLVSFLPGSNAGVWHTSVQNADSMRIFIEYEFPESTSSSSTTSSLSSSTTSSSSSSTTSSSSSSITSSSGQTITEVLSTLSAEASNEKTIATSTTTLVKRKPTTDTNKATSTTTSVKGSSTTTTASLSASSERVATEVPSTSSVESSTSTEKGTAASTTTLVQAFTCPPCAPCGSNVQAVKNMTLNELKKAVEELKSQLRVDKTKLSSSIRRRTSAVDKRPSASAVGGVIGGVITAAIFSAIVLPDIISLCRYIFVTLRRWKNSPTK